MAEDDSCYTQIKGLGNIFSYKIENIYTEMYIERNGWYLVK
jgi:hypothetical protein